MSNRKNKKAQELIPMILLGIIVLLLGGYLVYALAHPDRF
ncbi:potassium-transporting ATPase subunit F [Faecalibacterium sp. An122]|nr:potassium-transporting ATPase subunit F [Faecalibacterium sp. An122]